MTTVLPIHFSASHPYTSAIRSRFVVLSTHDFCLPTSLNIGFVWSGSSGRRAGSLTCVMDSIVTATRLPPRSADSKYLLGMSGLPLNVTFICRCSLLKCDVFDWLRFV